METARKVQGASILITGANGGIAVPVIQLLLERGAKCIVLACRTQEKAEEAKVKVTKDPEKLSKLHCHGGFDMCGDNKTLAQAVEALQQTSAEQPFDIIFLQAGGVVVADDWKFVTTVGSETKIEKTIYQNVVGGYITLIELEKRGLIAPKARIVFAGGEGARGLPPMMTKPQFASAEEWHQYITKGGAPLNKKYDFRQSIAESKFASALLVQKLASLQTEREYIWFSCGLTGGTNGLKDVPNPKKCILQYIGFPMMTLFGMSQNPQKAALKYVDCLDGIYGTQSGDILGAPESKGVGPIVDQKPMNSGFTDETLQNELWDIIKTSVGDITEVRKTKE